MASVRLVLVRSLMDGLLAKLSLDRKVELSQVLLGIAVADTQAVCNFGDPYFRVILLTSSSLSNAKSCFMLLSTTSLP
jgi:hypothetical protein